MEPTAETATADSIGKTHSPEFPDRYAQIPDFSKEELRAIVTLEYCVRRTRDPLKVVLAIEDLLLDLGYRSDIHVLTTHEDIGKPIPPSFPGDPGMRCPFHLEKEITGGEFDGCIDLCPTDPAREISDRERHFIEFFCAQAGSVLAHQFLYQNVSRTQERLQSALNTVQEVSAFVGHEIRSPLASLHSLSYLIEEEVRQLSSKPEIGSADWKMLVDQMAQSTQLLRKVVRSTYLLGTLELDSRSFRTDREWIEVGKSLLVSAASVYSHEIQRRNIFVVVRRESRFSRDHVYAQRTWFEAIFDNLLGNSIKYTVDGGRIDFSIMKEGGDYLIRVSNPVENPPSPERLNRLFEKGFRDHEDFSQRVIGANQGLGLYFVNRIVSIGYGGAVRVWLDKDRNRDGTGAGDLVETQTFGDPDARPEIEARTYFHIELRIDGDTLRGD